MRKPAKQNYILATSCLFAALLQIWFASPLDGSEFSGGRLTGPILNLSDYGGYLFLLTTVLALLLLRVSSAMAIAAGLLCVPLYLYAIAPGAFHRIFPGPYKEQFVSAFVWSPLAIAGVCSVALAILIAVYVFKKKQLAAPAYMSHGAGDSPPERQDNAMDW